MIKNTFELIKNKLNNKIYLCKKELLTKNKSIIIK